MRVIPTVERAQTFEITLTAALFRGAGKTGQGNTMSNQSNPPPALSVFMPVYNAERYLRDAVRSILDQTFSDFEFFIVNDGSTDSSLKLMRKLTAGDARVRIIDKPNSGIAKSCNAAVEAARGEFIARTDADDISMPDRFEKEVAYLRQNPGCVVVGSQVMTIDPYGSPLYQPKHDLDHDAIEKGLLAGVGWSIVQPVCMMRRQAVLDVGMYRTGFDPSEDLDLFLRLAEHGKLANLPDVLLQYRQHAKSANHARVAEQDRNRARILTEAYARRSMPLPQGWTSPKRKVLPLEQEIDMWGWTALRQHNLYAARRHGLALLKLAPLSKKSWRLMYCALRGR